MGSTFFVDWALWQKLTFVLAGAIVLTFTIGLCKLWYDTRRLQRYARVADKNAAALECLEAQYNTLEVEKQNAIPFGVRALESGIEVDGVWISRSNTPVPSSVASSPSSGPSAPKPRPESSVAIPQIELPEPAHDGIRMIGSRTHPIRRKFDPPISSRQYSSAARQVPFSFGDPGRDLYSYSNATMGRESTYNTLESSGGYAQSECKQMNPPSPSLKLVDSEHSIYHSSKSSLDSAAPVEDCVRLDLPPTTHGTNPAELKAALDMLHTHRLSHVAETGQLTPRARRPGQSGEWARVSETYRASDQLTIPQTRTPSPADSFTETSNPFTTPTPSSGNSPETPPTSQDNTEIPAYDSTALAIQERGSDAAYYDGQRIGKTPPLNTYNVPSTSNTHRNRMSQVLRKVNSGFEILRPGTLAMADIDRKSLEQHDAEQSKKRHSRKLQKKRVSVVS